MMDLRDWIGATNALQEPAAPRPTNIERPTALAERPKTAIDNPRRVHIPASHLSRRYHRSDGVI